MSEVAVFCPPEAEENWRDGKLFERMCKRLKGTIPKSWPEGEQCPPHGSYGFAECLAVDYFMSYSHLALPREGLKILVEGYYSKTKDEEGYQKASELLGPELAPLVLTYTGGQPPDLLVYSRDNRFFFSEAKRPTEPLSKTQKTRFPQIESLLRRYMEPGSQLQRGTGTPATSDIVIARVTPTNERKQWTRTLQLYRSHDIPEVSAKF